MPPATGFLFNIAPSSCLRASPAWMFSLSMQFDHVAEAHQSPHVRGRALSAQPDSSWFMKQVTTRLWLQ